MKKIIAANWKMYKNRDEAKKTLKELISLLPSDIFNQKEILIFPSPVLLQTVAEEVKETQISYGVQNFYPAEEGAFTGETGIAQMRDLGCKYALIGHSERRHILNESEELLKQKTHAALQEKITPVLCIGETLDERKAGLLEDVLSRQLGSALQDDKNADNFLVAYEPVWAIGTGEVAGEQEILQAHAFIRNWLVKNCKNGQKIPILYGGSVKPENSKQILVLDNVNGVLVGGASLNAAIFSKIALS